ncbi:MAG: WXG100 family type VII secretion target [Propionibacteriaceae bacterium]|jgi:WXG100 family type VII secretion target|nr:WXG100 family type VII secretion target [Propionibacteriaceae bacterium]
MANLSVSYEAMNQEAAALVAGKEDLLEKLNQLKSRVDNLVREGFVTDKASVAFQEDYDQFTQGANQTVAALDDIANRLTQTAQALADTDAALAGRG